MTKVILLSLIVASFSCSTSPEDHTEKSIDEYLHSNLNAPDTYQAGEFSSWKATGGEDTAYVCRHDYKVKNGSGDRVDRSIEFYLDPEYHILGTDPTSINGDYGSLSGNVFWKYNNFVGNKPDAGSKVFLYPVDSVAHVDQEIEADVDIRGDYTIDNLLPGKYFCIIKSVNVRDCPMFHYIKFSVYKDTFKKLFGIDLSEYVNEMSKIDSLYNYMNEYLDNTAGNYSSKNLKKSDDMYSEYNEKVSDFISSIPIKDLKKIKIIHGYDKAVKYKRIEIKERSDKNLVTDFVVQCVDNF